MTTQKIETRMDRGISLFRERSQEIREVEPGIYRAPSTTGRRGSGREQAGRAQETRQKDQGQVPGRTAEKKGEERVIFNPFAREVRVCVEAAVEEARMLGHDSIGYEDLLLGILHTDEGLAAEVLSSQGVRLEAAREEYKRMASDALSSEGISLEDIRREAGDAFDMRIPEGRRIPFSPRAKSALERALREAVKLRDKRLGTGHVLLGMLDNEDGRAVRMLGRMGVSSEALEERVFELRGREAGWSSGFPPTNK